MLAEIAPDLVVADLRLSLSVSARLAGIPYIAIANATGVPTPAAAAFRCRTCRGATSSASGWSASCSACIAH